MTQISDTEHARTVYRLLLETGDHAHLPTLFKAMHAANIAWPALVDGEATPSSVKKPLAAALGISTEHLRCLRNDYEIEQRYAERSGTLAPADKDGWQRLIAWSKTQCTTQR